MGNNVQRRANAKNQAENKLSNEPKHHGPRVIVVGNPRRLHRAVRRVVGPIGYSTRANSPNNLRAAAA